MGKTVRYRNNDYCHIDISDYEIISAVLFLRRIKMRRINEVLCKENFGEFVGGEWYDADLDSGRGTTIFVILNARKDYNYGRWLNISGKYWGEMFSDHFYTMNEIRALKIKEINVYESGV